jgi:hypothetical protein
MKLSGSQKFYLESNVFKSHLKRFPQKRDTLSKKRNSEACTERFMQLRKKADA